MMDPETARLEALKISVTRCEAQLERAQQNFNNQMQTAEPPEVRAPGAQQATSAHTRWEEANERVMDKLSKATNNLEQAQDMLRNAENPRQNQQQRKQHRFATLPNAKNIPKFFPSSKTTKLDCTKFLEKFEQTMEANTVPFIEGPEDDKRQRWYDCIHMAFAEAKQTMALRQWIKDIKEAKTSWTNFALRFQERFLKDTANLNATARYELFKQRTADTADFFKEFKERAKEAIFVDGIEMIPNWSTKMVEPAKLFVKALRPDLCAKLIDHDKFAESIHNLDALGSLAIKCDVALTVKASFHDSAKQHRTAKKHDRESGKNGKARTASSNRKQKQPCARCQRTHQGGANNCFAKTDVNGSKILSEPTAEPPARYNWNQTEGDRNNGNKRKAPSNHEGANGNDRQPRKKIARSRKGRGRNARHVNSDESEDNEDNDSMGEQQVYFVDSNGDQ
jgi:hypothetical protein